MVSRIASYEYWDGPAKATMKCIEGVWTDDDSKLLGGAFASPIHNGDWVASDTTSAMTIHKATASSDSVIGQAASEPQGPHVANSRYATVLLLGTFVKEVEVDPASAATISVGDTVYLSASGGYFGEGLWGKATLQTTTGVTLSNGTFALGPAGPSCPTGTIIPVLFGFRKLV